VNRRALIKSLAAVPLASAFQAAAPLGKVKITGFEIHKVSVRWRDLMFVEVHTDAGITGLGEATLESRTDVAEAVLRWLEPEYVGTYPTQKDGRVRLPDAPGLGIKVNFAEFERKCPCKSTARLRQ
jgi:L-alanine-DL-glutamate epimerase-like enolase superfamily enzyme